MNEDKLHLLCNGIASIADATDENFWDVLDELTGTIISEEDADKVRPYMETL